MVKILETINVNGETLQNVDGIDDNAGSQINFNSEVNHNGLDIEDVDDIKCNDIFSNVNTYIRVADDIDMTGEDIFGIAILEGGNADGNLHVIGGIDTVTIGNDLFAGQNDDLLVGDDLTVLGDVVISGNLAKSSGSFKIAHPLDPENKFLSHSFIESPEMRNLYYGQVETVNGKATITLPEWFHGLNGNNKAEFNYQLTPIGKSANLWVSKELKDFEFEISSDVDCKISWQLTAIRHDKFAEENRIPVETMRNKELEAMFPGLKNQSDNYMYDDDLKKPYRKKHKDMIAEQKIHRLEIMRISELTKEIRENILVEKDGLKKLLDEVKEFRKSKDKDAVKVLIPQISQKRLEIKNLFNEIMENNQIVYEQSYIVNGIQKQYKEVKNVKI